MLPEAPDLRNALAIKTPKLVTSKITLNNAKISKYRPGRRLKQQRAFAPKLIKRTSLTTQVLKNKSWRSRNTKKCSREIRPRKPKTSGATFCERGGFAYHSYVDKQFVKVHCSNKRYSKKNDGRRLQMIPLPLKRSEI